MTAEDLKNSILQLAVEGKLVPQDPGDEPASVLLKKIRTEKQKMVSEGKIKKEKHESQIIRRGDSYFEKVDGKEKCIDDEIPFDIPDTWEWTKLENITYAVGNKSNQIAATQIKKEGKYPVVSQGKNLIEGYFDDEEKVIRDLPLVMFGDHTRNVKYIDFEFIIGADGTKFHKVIIVSDKYIYYWMTIAAYLLRNRGYARHYSLLKKEYIPIPPLTEQKRIVSKIEELMPLVEEFGAKETELNKLQAAFPKNLKKSVLQEAVQGKLVPQDPGDEPASVLLKKIRAEKQKMVSEGKIKKEKHESQIVRRGDSYFEKVDGKEKCIDDEIPFEIPDTWEWVRLGNICDIARGGSPRPIKQYITDSEDGVNWIKIGDTVKGEKYIYSTKEKIITEGISKSRLVHSGDLLLTNSMSFGRPYILKIDGCIHDGWLVLADFHSIFKTDFLYLLLSSPFAYYQFCDVVSGAVVKNLNIEKVINALVPLPPLAEQQRIVDKIEEIMPQINNLSV